MPRLTLEEIWPPFGLRVRAGDLSLAVIREDDVAELVEVVLEGIHAPDTMPFLFPWTDVPAEELPGNYMRYVGRNLAGQSADSTSMQFVVRRGADVVGVQALEGDNFAATRTLETGSWLGRRFHGQGVGTRMRQAVCALAFDHLGAQRVTSSAFMDNPSSQAVSRKVGYQPNGRHWIARGGEGVEEQRFVLTPETFQRGEPVEVSGASAMRRFLGLDD